MPIELIAGAVIGTIGGVASAVLVPATRYGLMRALAASVAASLLCAALAFSVVYALVYFGF